MNISLAAVLAFIGLFITARFQRTHWLRSTHEEIRVRETKEASELVKDIATTFDRRIAAQRLLLLNMDSQDREKFEEIYLDAVREYMHRFNEIRYRLNFYLTYGDVLKFEADLNNRIVVNGSKISLMISSPEKVETADRSKLDNDLSIISALVFRYCRDISEKISKNDFGSLRRISNWKDPENQFVTIGFLLKRLLNI